MLKRFYYYFKLLCTQKSGVSAVIIISIFVILAITAPILPIADPFQPSYDLFDPPSMKYLMGTDHLGRDVFARTIWGARASLFVGVVGAGFSMILGVIVGAIAGYFGGLIDSLLSRMIEILLIIPLFFLLIMISVIYGHNIMLVALAIGMVSWPRNARIMRAQTLSLKKQPFVEVAVCFGASPFRIIFRHIIPNGSAPVIANSMLLIGFAILTEAGLSFLGLGDPNIITWGAMIQQGSYYLSFAFWASFFPGLMVMMLACSFSLLGDAYNYITNPRTREVVLGSRQDGTI